MKDAVVSRHTYAVATFSVVATALTYAMILFGTGEESVVAFWADVGETVIAGVAASVLIWAALQFGPRESLRRYWLLIGLGAVCFTLGDVAWTYYEVVQGVEVPYPGIPDVFYLLEYPLSAAGFIGAALAYRRIFDIRQPVAISGLVTVLAAVGVWFGFVGEIATDAGTPLWERILGVAYPIGDITLLLAPALFIVLVIGWGSGARLAWPWRTAALGLAVLAATDTAFAWLDWTGVYASGHPIDAGWMLGYSLLAIGASLAVDVHRAGTR